VRGEALAETLGVELTRDGRVPVAPDLTLPGHPEVAVVGDLAAVRYGDGWVPGMAPGAIQEGRHAARNIERALRGEPALPFRYRDKGLLATVGRAAAVARVGGVDFGGWVAWALWLGVHIVWLIGFRNRLAVLFEWAWAYVTWQRSARVILRRPAEAAAQGSLSPPAARR
jgi:NADH dehydrogenase